MESLSGLWNALGGGNAGPAISSAGFSAFSPYNAHYLCHVPDRATLSGRIVHLFVPAALYSASVGDRRSDCLYLYRLLHSLSWHASFERGGDAARGYLLIRALASPL